MSHLGVTTANFTVTKEFFLWNASINLWRFEVVYSFSTDRSSSSLNFVVNQPPRNGTCSIDPQNGTTTTLFTVSCPHWLDEDQIKDYSLLSSSSFIHSIEMFSFVSFATVWSADPSLRALIAFSAVSIFEVYLPADRDPTCSLQLVIHIRDQRDCLTEWTNLSSITVRTDSTVLDDLLNNIVTRSTTTRNRFVSIVEHRKSESSWSSDQFPFSTDQSEE